VSQAQQDQLAQQAQHQPYKAPLALQAQLAIKVLKVLKAQLAPKVFRVFRVTKAQQVHKVLWVLPAYKVQQVLQAQLAQLVTQAQLALQARKVIQVLVVLWQTGVHSGQHKIKQHQAQPLHTQLHLINLIPITITYHLAQVPV
jgi:hypothetical protein